MKRDNRMSKLMDDDWIWPEFPWIGAQGSLHDLRDADQPGQRSRLWDLKSTSKAGLHRLRQATGAEGKAPQGRFYARRPR